MRRTGPRAKTAAQGAVRGGKGPSSLSGRFARHVEKQAVLAPGDRVVVACSGGIDSLTLLHLLRFGKGLPRLELRAAHFDHRMRPDSGEDAAWVRGLCRAWGIPLHHESAIVPPTSEEEAREARYGFLVRVLREEGGSRLLTGHQADDQAETVLFRIFRGTGLRGLTGIPQERAPGLYRPLLPFRRGEILSYAAAHGLRPRHDPTNLDMTFSRNLLRHRILPEVEKGVAPRPREALLRLARIARENEDAWQSLLPDLLKGVLEEKAEGIVIARTALLAHHPGVRVRILREGLRRQGIRVRDAGTRDLLEFTRSGASGGTFFLPGGGRLRREFDRFVLEREEEAPRDVLLAVPGPEAGSGEVILGGRIFQVHWGPTASEVGGAIFRMAKQDLAFPLMARAWRPGDRILLPYGTKKLKKLFSEARIPAGERARIPVLSDARGRILWVVGVATSTLTAEGRDEEPFYVGIQDVAQH